MQPGVTVRYRLAASPNASSNAKECPICTLKVLQFDQTSALATSIVVRSEEVTPLQEAVQLPLQVRYNVETVLIVLLVLFLLASGGWGYRRYRG